MSSGRQSHARRPDVSRIEHRVFDLGEAQAVLRSLAGNASPRIWSTPDGLTPGGPDGDSGLPILEARYRTLLEQMSAIVFMAYLDRGIGEAYVSPHVEATLGFSQEEWLGDPVRWYAQIHPGDKDRWSVEAAEMFLTGTALRSVYRVLARDGHVVWFQCEARMVRKPDGQPWFIQGVAFDISDLKRAEAALNDESSVLSTILDTVGALVVVLDSQARITRFNRACELTTGYLFDDVKNRYVWDLFATPEDRDGFKATFRELCRGGHPGEYEATAVTRAGVPRRIAWSSTVVPASDGVAEYIIATGIDVTERRRLQKTILELSDREERRIGQDLHDGLGQHLTGIAFICKVLEQKLAENGLPEAAEADRILALVNEAITKTRELARGLLPMVSDHQGLAAALEQIARDVEDLFGITCRLVCDVPLVLCDLSASTQLCRIAREAVNNAIKHGRASTVVIHLSACKGSGVLAIRDDGIGFPIEPSESGMGLHIMRYRAGMIGGTLQIERGGQRNTTITCVFPVDGVG